ncbi:MFS transporter [Nocardia crassostreae]|uniref:MFS transporter n=1 Tax=Nocardia crassostreae TaxID=53428 RepID=UPI000B0858DC|nr:MFS transporter [Nocardia crassostreae]
MAASVDRPTRYPLLGNRNFAWFWTADTVSLFGTYVTTQALQLLAVLLLSATTVELGALRAAQWAPYLLFGLIAGVLADRLRRQPILVTADLARAVLLALIPLAAAFDILGMPLLIALMLGYGTISVLYDAAYQSFLPNLVPARLLTQANARLEQSAAVAQVGGQAVAGVLIKLLCPPTAILVDASSYLVSGVILARLRVTERTPPPDPAGRNLRIELMEGVRWVYRHPALGPLALSSHAWFFCTSMVSTIYPFLVVRELGFDAAAYGSTLAVGGLGAVAGSFVSVPLGRRFEVGPVVIGCLWLAPAGYALLPLARNGIGGFVLLCAAQFVFWLSVATDSPLEMAYRQLVTPDRLLGRMSATIRSMNRGALVIGALAGGVLADRIGVRPAVWVAVIGLCGAALGLTGSGFRHARLH